MLIVNFGQVVDLEHGNGLINQFTVLMPDGSRVSIVTDEGTVGRLIELTAGVLPEEGQDFSMSIDREAFLDTEVGVVPSSPPEEPEGVEFGGDYDPGEEAPPSAPVMGTIAEERVGALAAPGGLGTPGGARLGLVPQQRQAPRPMVDGDGYLVPPRGKTVQSDEKGYPVVAQARPAAAASVAGEDDDDGTQI